MSGLQRFLSHFWPITERHLAGRYGPLHVVWENGRRVVNSDRANQSHGSLHRVWQLCFADAGVAQRKPSRVLILGFGAGSAARILRQELGLQAAITGVDGDPAMLDLAVGTFHVKELGGITLVESDAHAFLSGEHATYDLVVVDLFHERDLAPGVGSEAFMAGLRRCVAPGGMVCFNTVVHDEASRERSRRIGRSLRADHPSVEEHRYEGLNRVFIAL